MYKRIAREHVLASILVLMLLAGCVPQAAVPPTEMAPTAAPPTEPAPPIASPTSPPPDTTQVLTATPTRSYEVATTAEQVLGTWNMGDYIYLRFDADGTMRQAHALEKLDAAPVAISSYRFDGDRMVTVEIELHGVPSCQMREGRYELRLLEDGHLSIVAIKDDCKGRRGDTEGEYEPVQ